MDFPTMNPTTSYKLVRNNEKDRRVRVIPCLFHHHKYESTFNESRLKQLPFIKEVPL